MGPLRNIFIASLAVFAFSCSSVKSFFDLGADDTGAIQENIQANSEKTSETGGRGPASISQNPLRIMEYCAVDNFSRVLDCYPSLELCQKAARGFAMCSGR